MGQERDASTGRLTAEPARAAPRIAGDVLGRSVRGIRMKREANHLSGSGADVSS